MRLMSRPCLQHQLRRRRTSSIMLSAAFALGLVLLPVSAFAKCLYTNPDAPLTLPDTGGTRGLESVAKPAVPPPAVTASLNPGFAYHPPGDLMPQDKGRGRSGDRRVYAPGMIFPVKLERGGEMLPPGKHAFMNSQIWNSGGGGYGKVKGPGGAECNPANFNPLLQRDNFCEVRSWSMPMCPSGQGHQGQDIRPPKCEDNKWEVVAVTDGIITKASSSTLLALKADDGTLYEYLHLHPSSYTVSQGDRVKQGQVLGRISNYMGGSPDTTRHLHFNIQQTISIDGQSQRVYVPPYTSLIAAYRRSKELDPGIDKNGNLIIDPLLEIGAQLDKDAPPITTWAIPNITGNDGKALASVALSKYFRAKSSATKLRYSAVGLPAGVLINPETGEVRGTLQPQASRGGANGAYTVTAMVDDGQGNKAQQSFIISALYSPPQIGTATRGKFFKDGGRVLIDAGAAFLNPSAVPLTFTATGLPPGITITPATGRILGRLSKTASKGGNDGVYTVTVTANDGKASISQKFTITAEPQKDPNAVVPGLPPPIVTSALPSVEAFAGQPIVPIEAGSAFKPGYGYQTMKFQAVSLPLALNIDPDTGRISGTLSADALRGGTSGSYTVKVIADNGEGGTSSQSFVLTAKNRGPVVVIPTINKVYNEGETVVVAVGAAFSAPEDSVLTYTVTGLPEGVRFDAASGRVVGTVAAGAAAARPNGVYSIVATADDGKGGRVSQTFAVTVQAQKAPPVVTASIPSIAVIEGMKAETILAGASFKPGITSNVLEFSATGLPPGLQIDLLKGEIAGTVAAGVTEGAATKRYDVTVTATDIRTQLTASQQTTIVVVQAPKPVPVPEPAKPTPAADPKPSEPKPSEPTPVPPAPPKPEPAPTPEPPKPVPAPEPPKPTPAPEPAPQPPPTPAPEPPKPAPTPEPPKPAPAPEPPKPTPAPEPPKPAPAPEPPKPAAEPPKPATPVPLPPASPPPPAEAPKTDTWGSWAYGYAKGAWDWATGLWTKKP